MNCEIELPNASANFHKNEEDPWAIGNLKGLKLELIVRNTDVKAKIVCSQLSIDYPDHPLCSNILSTSNLENFMECLIISKSVVPASYEV